MKRRHGERAAGTPSAEGPGRAAVLAPLRRGGARVGCRSAARLRSAPAASAPSQRRGTPLAAWRRQGAPQGGARRSARGFTLLEVVAATLLLAIAFAALMQVVGGSIRLGGNAADYSRAALWARSLLDSAYVLEPPQPGSQSGRFDDQYRWQLDVRPWQMPRDAGVPPGLAVPPGSPGALMLYRLDLAVYWGRVGHERVARFSTLRLASVPANRSAP